MIARNKSVETVWVVVVVKGGFPVSVEVHRDRKIAKQRERFLSKDLREAYDEIGLFEGSTSQEILLANSLQDFDSSRNRC